MSKKIATLILIVSIAAIYVFLLVLLPMLAEAVECASKAATENITNVTGNVTIFANIGEPTKPPESTFDKMPKVYLILPGLIGGAILVMIWLNPAKKV
jgi:hypothetical protein